jgi:hypothetical protein
MIRDVVVDASHLSYCRLLQWSPIVCAAVLHATFSDRAAIGARDSHGSPLNPDYCDSLGRYAPAIFLAGIPDDRVRRQETCG